MDLSADVIDGLHIIGDSSKIPDTCYMTLLEETCNSLISTENVDILQRLSQQTSVDPGPLKQGFAGLVTLLLEAAKQDKDASILGHILEDCKFTSDRITAIEKVYSEYKDKLRLLLSNTGTSLPHIVDVKWRLDYYIKNNHTEKVNEPTFLINLKTEECGQQSAKDVQFACTQDQLQDLVGKLKDACKSLERASQM